MMNIQRSKIASFQTTMRGDYYIKVSVLQDMDTELRTILVAAHNRFLDRNPLFIVRYFVDMESAADFIDALAHIKPQK
jgi:hypothetical protein